MTHAKLMDATRALEDALKDQEKARLVWLIERTAHPSVIDPMASELYCEASNAVADAQQRHFDAMSEAQAEYLRPHIEAAG